MASNRKKWLIKNLKEQAFPPNIIRAFDKIDRSLFVPKEYIAEAYENIPLPINYNQTISQPYTIAFMLTLLKLKDKQKILEVGSGSGYVLALLSHLSSKGKIFGVERIKELADKSQKLLEKYKNVKVIHGDGSKGLKEEQPFDRILVSAAASSIPQNLVRQLKFSGIMVVPVNNSIIVLEKTSGENKITEYPGFVFVPLISD